MAASTSETTRPTTGRYTTMRDSTDPSGPDGPGAQSARGVPVLYLLHGLSDDCTHWERRTAIERYATEKGIAVVDAAELPQCAGGV